MRNFSLPVLSLPRSVKILVVFSVDANLCVLTVWLAYYLRLGQFVKLVDTAFLAVVAAIVIAQPIFIFFGLYRAIFRYHGWQALLNVARAIGVYALFYSSIFTAIGVHGIPRTIGIIQPILLLLLVAASRALAGLWLGEHNEKLSSKTMRSKTFIYGAGTSGRQLAAAMANSPDMQVIGFLDDDEKLHGHILNGLPIYNPSDLPKLSKDYSIKDVLLAIPSASRRRRNEILGQIRDSQVSVRTLPSMSDLTQGKVKISDINELDIDDLLGREPVAPDQVLLKKNITGKTIMITGAGGSIGSELSRQIATLAPNKILLVEQSEYALYKVHQELLGKGFRTLLVPLLASVQDEKRMNDIMVTWHPNTVYHAAAYKHVPLVEQNITEGIKNNVIGTLKTARCAISVSVDNFVLISTDKAVRPTNVMGASKRLAEIILQALAAENPSTNFSMVRFGNVLDSSGSVVPKFREQIKVDGVVTITHPEITRFFMTIPEAAQLVIQAGAMAKGGDVFVLDMGKPVKIMELAHRMIELSGLTVKDDSKSDGDIEIEIIGLRAGEKLYEELLIGNNTESTPHDRIMKASEDFIRWPELKVELETLATALSQKDIGAIYVKLKKLVSEYEPIDGITDLVYTTQRKSPPKTAKDNTP